MKFQKEIIEVDLPEALAAMPFSQAIKVGNMVFVAGQVAYDLEKGELITGSIEEQTESIFGHIKRILEVAGTSLDNLVKIGIFMDDLDEYEGMNKVRKKYIGDRPPVSTCVRVAGLMMGMKVEIEAVAVIPDE